MSQNIISIVSPTDRTLLSFFRVLFENALIDRLTLNLGPTISLVATEIEEFENVVSTILNLEGKLIQAATFDSISNLSYTFYRSIFQDNHRISSIYEAEFDIRPNQKPVQDGIAMKILLKIASSFQQTVEVLSNEKSVNSSLSSQTERMFSIATGVTEQLAKAQIDYDQKLQDHIAKLENEDVVRKADFEQEKKQVSALLEEKRIEAERKLEELDLGRARDARRKKLDEITQNLSERIQRSKVSPAVSKYRNIILLITYTALSLAILGAIFSGTQIHTITDGSAISRVLLVYGRLFSSSILATVLFFYLISYFKKVEQEEVLYERDLERFSLDINRANWVAETIIEFGEEEDGLTVPDAWLNGVTSNLFSPHDKSELEEDSAISALGSLLKAGTKLKVGTSGVEIELDKSTAKKVGQSVG